MKERHRRSGRGWAASAAAVLVVGVIALLLVSTRAFGHPGPAGGGMAPPTPTEGMGPPTPAASAPAWAPTPRPIPYLISTITAKGVDASGQPVDPTSQFMPNQLVYVILTIRNAPVGRHSLSIRWYLDGTRLQLPSAAETSVDITAPNTTVYFTLSYPSAGRGAADIYVDLPPNTPDAQANVWLAQEVNFEIA